MRLHTFVSVTSLAVALVACQKDEDLTSDDAREALEESSVESQASGLTATSVELSTSFTLGKAARDAATELRGFIETQLPCADVTASEGTLTVRYGAKPGTCTYRGQTFSGTHTITVQKSDDQAIVEHTWSKLSNGRVEVSGEATVTWDKGDQTRRVQHDLTWTRLTDGRTGRGTGDSTQRPLAGGISEGIKVDGERAWSSNGKTWDLEIDGIEARWADPVPQAGAYRLSTPKGGTIEAGFRRVTEELIEVTLSRGAKSFKLYVRRGGDVEDDDGAQ